MTGPTPILRSSRLCLGFLLVFLVGTITLDASAADPKHVLILNPFGRNIAPYSAAISVFRSTLAMEFGEPVEFDEVALDLGRFTGPEGEGPLVAFLASRLESHPADLVVPFGGSSVQFADRHRARLFPDTPILVTAAEPRMVPPEFLSTNATLVSQQANIPGMVEDILQLQPDTTQVVVIFGSSPLEKYWLEVLRREFQVFTDRITFTYVDDLPFDEVLKKCSSLPPGSFILHVFYLVDPAGIPYERDEPLRRLHEVANAPLFGYFESELGLGPIGGRLFHDSEIGVLGARTAIRMLRGESPGSIPPQLVDATTPVFDWRELQRWGISEERLPAGSTIRFRQPGLWGQYRWPITGLVSFALLQTALIISLLASRARLHREEAAAALVADISSKFVNLPPSEVDREIRDAERRICEWLDLDLAVLWQWSDRDPGFFTPTHVYNTLGETQLLGQMSHEDFPWVQQQMLAGRTISLSSLEELPAEAASDREVSLKLGIKSNLTLPLSLAGELPIGALALNTLRAERHWPKGVVRNLGLIAQIFTNALSRKRADQALSESEERFRLMMEQAPDAILVKDIEQDQFILANAQAEKLFGCGREELLATGPERFYTAKQSDGKPVQESMREYSQRALRGEMVLFEQTISSTAGQQFHCEVRLARLPAGDRKLVRSSFVDITRRKQTEAALHDFGALLMRAHEQERARLARELHDDVTQRLARLAIDAGLVQGSGTSTEEAMSSIRDGLVRLSEDIHSLSYRLHPSLLKDLGLAEALRAECERFSRQESLAVVLKPLELPAFVPHDTALCLFRVAQEALGNAARHSQASRIEVSIRPVDGGLQLAVLDDGIGFEPATPRKRPSLGLTSMRERLLMIGGEFEIESAPGRGTAVLAWTPLEKES